MALRKTLLFQFILTDKHVLMGEQEVIQVLASVGFNQVCQKSALAHSLVVGR